ncbi:hypothetical protein XENOCAPTIV_017432 [Xenoophorus captivus]|uniref:Uncharacterized protein n=1 Tax=Xenoophorus captivus TaxID=1517983 RepID=A0ABV0QM64_9TELE
MSLSVPGNFPSEVLESHVRPPIWSVYLQLACTHPTDPQVFKIAEALTGLICFLEKIKPRQTLWKVGEEGEQTEAGGGQSERGWVCRPLHLMALIGKNGAQSGPKGSYSKPDNELPFMFTTCLDRNT